MDGDFFALMFRMKYISRWGLMRQLRQENLSEHSLECAILAHSLAVIGNKIFGKNYDPAAVALKAMYHDAPEIITGDMPTPVKYFDESTRSAYKAVESHAIDRFISLLPDNFKPEYESLFRYTDDEKKLIKSADKLCAYIKCLEETNLGNNEFQSALSSTKTIIDNLQCEELNYFMANYVSSFNKSLDELQNKDI
ncbi:MAG: 5'-deoxynucleotidase [Eubacteriales bacterium]|jgi:5'-deoxynucleotidase